MELRERRQHSQKGCAGFLFKMLQRARKVTHEHLLVRTKAAHDTLETLVDFCRHAKVDFIVTCNLRRADIGHWTDQACAQGRLTPPRAGERAAVFSPCLPRRHNGKTYRFRLVIRVTKRISDPQGPMLLQLSLALKGWWTSLPLDEEHVIALYENWGFSEPLPSEITSYLDLKRFPSGKCATNALVLTLAGFAGNTLRLLGQSGLLRKRSLVRHSAKRRDVSTVSQGLIRLAAPVIRKGRRLKLQFGRHWPAFDAFRGVNLKFCPR
ncbi:transposase [Desulfosoma sp.]|uniref:transposase n=1 Tax=Desulfosoma sp. TaxID=2603217 RepID=UPI00404B014A